MPRNYRIKDPFNYYEINDGGCWIWKGAINGDGYPQLRRDGRNLRMHREFYKLHKGQIAEGMLVCHKCDVRNCVNPDHLFLGTTQDNTNDMMAKGRNVPPLSGEKHNHAKLNEQKVLEILKLNKEGRAYRSIAREFGIHHTTISDLINGKNWKYLTNRANA